MATATIATRSTPSSTRRGESNGYSYIDTRMIASHDGAPRPIIMWERIEPFVIISQGLSKCDVATDDAQECAEFRCRVPPAATAEHMSMCHHMCRSATRRQALRERGWPSADGTVAHSADCCVLCTYALSCWRATFNVIARME